MRLKKAIIFIFIFSILVFSTNSHAIGIDTSVTPNLVIGGTQGTADGEFDEPDSVYIDAEGTVFAGDTQNLRVQVFDEAGEHLRNIEGEFTPLSSKPGNEVQGIGELADGSLVVVEKAGNLFQFNKTTGALIAKLGLSALVDDNTQVDTQGLAVDPATDVIYISNQPEHKTYGLHMNGTVDVVIFSELSSTPENIAIDSNYIYISVEGHRRINYYSKDGTLVGHFGRDDATFNFEGITIDKDGFIWVVDEGPDQISQKEPSRIVMYSPDNYTALYSFGGTTPGTAEGKFLSPDGIAYDAKNDRLFVADQGNFRLQVFDMEDLLAAKAVYVEPTTSEPASQDTSSSDDDSSFNAVLLAPSLFITIIIAKKKK